jgi:long-subunit acyl-CoA synthetase (AMP-forming)
MAESGLPLSLTFSYRALQIDYPTLSWAVHRLSGIVSPANAMHSVRELVYQLKDSKAKCLFATAMQLQTSIEAALEVGIPQSRIYLIDSPSVENKIEGKAVVGFKTLNQLIYEGSFLQELDEQIWRGGQSTWQTAYICYSSGTSGIPVSYFNRHQIAH